MLETTRERTTAALTRTELKILGLIRDGLTNKEIAKAIFRSEFTIKTHVQRMLEKTGAKNRRVL